MKKFVKSLVIASSIAAVVGVGAVSFAKWGGDTDKDMTATGNVGSIALMGFDTAQNIPVTLSNAIIPYDQGTVTETGVTKYWTCAIPSFTVTESYQIKVTYTGATLSTTATDDSKSGGFYASISTTALTDATVPTDLTGLNLIDATSGWTYKPADISLDEGTNSLTVSDLHINIVLNSKDTADMGKANITFTVALEKKTA